MRTFHCRGYKDAAIYSGKWDFAEIGEIADIGSGNSAPQGEIYFKKGRYPFYRTSDVGKVHISTNLDQSVDCVNDLAVKEKRLHLFPKNTILFPKSGASTFLNHRVMISREGYVSSHLATIVPDENKVHPLFLFHLLCTIDAKALTPDQAYPSLKISRVQQIKIPLPPLEIQEKIVAELDGYQKIINGAKQIIENYKPTIKIDPSWEMVELGEVCSVQSGGTPSKNKKEYWEHGDIPWVGSTVCKDCFVNRTQQFITEEGLKNSSAKIFKPKTTLIALVGATIGKTAFLMVESATNQNIAGIYPKDDKMLLPEFVFYISQILYGEFMNLGSGKFRMANLSFVKSLKIPLPPIDVQQQIVNQIKKEQRLVGANKELLTLFEQKIKDRIAQVWGEK